jgi:ribosomal protein S19
MSRSKWKTPYINLKAIKNVFLKKKITVLRSSTIPFLLLNKTVDVYNGKIFKKITITRNKIGFKFGEFVPTRNLPVVKKKQKQKLKQKPKPKPNLKQKKK